MKKITGIVASAVMIMVSCSKDFIELPPVSSASVEFLYKTDKDFQDAVIGCYNIFQSQYQNFWKFSDLPSDDITEDIPNNFENVAINEFNTHNRLAVVASSWQNYYKVITRANTILSTIEKTDVSVVKNKERHIGEARFLRALAYFDLVRIYGDVPMVTVNPTVGEAYKTRREKVDVIYNEVIIKDLLEAETRLALKYTGTDEGRATRGAAKALLGKVYLTHKEFAKAEAKLQEVTSLGYALLAAYKDLFDYKKNEHHSEYVFDIEYEEGINEGSVFTHQFLPFAKVITDFYGISGSPGNSGSPTESLYAAFEPKDLRRDISVAYGVTKNGVFIPIPTTSIQASKSFSTKYIAPSVLSYDSKANWKVIRYADVLLMYAEALNENGKINDAIKYLNQVRTRAGVDAYLNLTQQEAREKIYLERRLELSLEGHRWFDLVRTGRALGVMAPYGMKPYMTVFPIPLSQIQIINDPEIFPQNPGYN
jgi:starch-binding outer membrane protein, SusD/RagB family